MDTYPYLRLEAHRYWVQEDSKMAAEYAADGDLQGAEQCLKRALEHVKHLKKAGGGE